MQITIDSGEPLAKVTALIGALYGVDLVVAGDGATPAATPAATSRRRGRGGAASAAPTRSAGRGRRSGSGGAPKTDPKIVRQWAVEQGMTVSTRGQLPKAVLTAYRESNA